MFGETQHLPAHIHLIVLDMRQVVVLGVKDDGGWTNVEAAHHAARLQRTMSAYEQSARMRQIDLYLIQNNINGKMYVGQTSCGYLKRWSQHCAQAQGRGVKHCVHLALARYGVNNFTISKLVDVSEDLADEYEEMFIEQYDTMTPKGYNMCRGGSGKAMLQQENIQKMQAKRWAGKELPMNIVYHHVDNNEGYVVRKIGYGNSKAFMSMKSTMDEKLEMAKHYLSTLKDRGPKTPRELPKHITRIIDKQRGRQYLKIEIKRSKKVVFWKSFCSGEFSQQLQRAKDCLEELKKQGVIQ